MKTIFSTIITTAGCWFVAIVLLSAAAVRADESLATAWVQRYSHPTPSTVWVRDGVTDHAGNIIVVGGAYNGVTGGDFLVIKYSGAGVPLWTNRYDGPGSLDDGATAVAVDASDSVFVTGICCSDGWESGDYATIKYSGAGVPLWTNRYNGPGNFTDEPRAIAVDSLGNVFVTGNSAGVDSWSDYATVAYSGAGRPLWTNRYKGPANGFDAASAIAVDSAGNVFVTGSSGTSDTLDDGDYATVAYSGAGVPLWTNRYNGPANGSDIAGAIAVGANGNVFVTGSSGVNSDSFEGADRVADYATVAYSGAGELLWVNRYNGMGEKFGSGFGNGQDVAVDADGNVLVITGRGNLGFATLKYSGAGVPLWTNRHDAPGGGAAGAHSLAVDSNGNVLVAGFSGPAFSYHYVTIKYSGSGATLWTSEYGNGDYFFPEAVAVDGNGNVFVAGAAFATVAYSGAGALLWTNTFSEVGNADDYPYALAVDRSGNVLVTGSSVVPENLSVGREDYATVAYSGAGVPLWTNRYNGPGNWYDCATAIGVDGSGNVFVTGTSWMPTCCSRDYATIKYSGAGMPLWTNRYGDPLKQVNDASALAVDGSGNVIVTGSSGWFDYDYATIKYSGAGVPLWTNRFDGPGGVDDYPSAVAVDSGGNVFVTGVCSSNDGDNGDYATIKYSSAGVPLWTNRYDGPRNDIDHALALAVDNGDNVIVTGNSVGSDAYRDCATIKYSGAGVPLWTNRYTGGHAPAIAVDHDRNVLVTGTSWQGDSPELFTIKYSEAGVLLWTNRYPGSATAIAVDASGDVFVTGSYYHTNNSSDLVVIKYSGAGVLLGTNRYQGRGDPIELRSRRCLAIGPDSSALVTAGSARGFYDFVTIKYISVPVLEIRRSAADVVLSWPSPFSDFTLQQNKNLTTTNWSNVSAPVQDDGTHRAVTISPPTGERFYRLSKP